MKANSSPTLELPQHLQHAEELTQSIAARAVYLQGDINATSGSNERKYETVKKAVVDLDRLAEGVYMGETVQIEGNYDFPQGVVDGNKFVLEPRAEYGIRRGKSLGFYVNFQPELDADGDQVSDNFEVEISHGIVMGEMVLGNRLFNLMGRSMINAPVEKSSIVLAEIEDYRKAVFAEMFVRQNRRDSRWTDSIDVALLNQGGPDMRALGSRLARLRAQRADRVEEYLTYVNTMLSGSNGSVELICDSLLSYAPGLSTPTLIRPTEPVSGVGPDVCFADTYKLDEVRRLAFKSPKQTPTLSMRPYFNDKEGEQILHIPLSAIHCAEFK